MVICKSDNFVNCSQQEMKGLLIFTDENNDGIVHTKNQILKIIQVNPPHGTLRWQSYPYYHHYVRFQPEILQQNDNSTFLHCHSERKSPLWALMLGKFGKTMVVYPVLTCS